MILATKRTVSVALCLGILALNISLPVHAQTNEASIEELRAKRKELLSRIAVLTDGAEAAQARFVNAQLRLADANSQVKWAKDKLADHAVGSYIKMINGEGRGGETLARERIWNEIVGKVDDTILDRLVEAKREAEAENRRAEYEAGASREASQEVNSIRQELEKTIAQQENQDLADEAKRNAKARQSAFEAQARDREAALRAGLDLGNRHRRATEEQARLLTAYPFGVVEGLPPRFTRTGETFEGSASWYGPGFDGRPTASGAIFDQEAWTVAHRDLPFGTILLITHGTTTVMALVNDRGPYVDGRVLDLSHGVANALGTVRAGVASVQVDIALPPDE